MTHDDFEIQFAVAITAYDGNPEPIDDPSYGKLIAGYNMWNNGVFKDPPNIALRNCTKEELGLVKGK